MKTRKIERKVPLDVLAMSLAMVLLVLFAVVGVVNMANAQGIADSAHDFSALTSWNTAGEICNVCHTPHAADTTVADAPLWDHELTTHDPYGLYGSTTLDATMTQPDGLSKLCLSCHDGTVAVDNFGGTTTGTVNISSFGTNSSRLIGTDLGDDHPVGFIFNATLASTDGELFNPAVDTTDLGGTIENDLLFGATGSARLECASCHDVHDTAGNTSLLRIDNAVSNLCLTCHDK